MDSIAKANGRADTEKERMDGRSPTSDSSSFLETDVAPPTSNGRVEPKEADQSTFE